MKQQLKNREKEGKSVPDKPLHTKAEEKATTEKEKEKEKAANATDKPRLTESEKKATAEKEAEREARANITASKTGRTGRAPKRKDLNEKLVKEKRARSKNTQEIRRPFRATRL